MASTEVGTENNRTQIPAGGDVDRTTQDLIHFDLNNHNGSVFSCFLVVRLLLVERDLSNPSCVFLYVDQNKGTPPQCPPLRPNCLANQNAVFPDTTNTPCYQSVTQC